MASEFVPPQGLVDAAIKRELVPFIGAGVSVGAVAHLAPEQRFPDWKDLILRLATRLEKEKGAAVAQAARDKLPDTMAAAQYIVDQLGRPSFLREMELAFDRFRPPDADLSAVEAIWKLQPPFVITTNYDRVLEWPWKSPVKRILNHEATPLGDLTLDPSYSKPRIWHLHGSIDEVDTLILTQDQYLKLYPDGDDRRTLYQNAYNHLQHLLTTRSFLYIGFSLTEPVLRRKIQDVLNLTGKASPISYLLLRKGNATDDEKKKFFDDYHVQVIEFEDFGAPMVHAIDAIHRAAWPQGQIAAGWALMPNVAPLVEDLVDKTAGLIVSPRFIRRAHRLSGPRGFRDTLKGADSVTLLNEAIPDLARAVNQATDGLPPLLKFVNRLRTRAPEPWRTRLTKWLDDAAQRLGVDTALLDDDSDPESAAPVQVLVRIRTNADAPSQVAAGDWLVHAWSWTEEQPIESLFGPKGRVFKEGSSDELVFQLVTELEDDDGNPDNTSIAFIVPASLAWQPIHQWRMSAGISNDPPIGATYLVTMRSLERAQQVPVRRLRFKKVWDQFTKNTKKMFAVLNSANPVPPVGVHAVMLDASTIVDYDLRTTLEKPQAPCVVLRQPPSANATAQLSDVLTQTSAPVVVWSAHVDQAVGEQAVRQLLESGTIESIPQRVRANRYAAFRDKTGQTHGADVMLIWDNADLLPPEQDSGAKAGVELT